ncbi:hypothetical protein KC973_00460 [Candidatus Saccharibacteria bacterium]|nr:hypothetical protein [Candidatus Saccharibacteria bacterium]
MEQNNDNPSLGSEHANYSTNRKTRVVKRVLLVSVTLVLLVATAGTTYYFTKIQIEDNAAEKISTLEKRIEDLEEKQHKDVVSEENSDDYLNIPQWGVRIKIGDPTVSYTIDGFVKLTNSSLRSLPGCENAYGASLSRFPDKQDDELVPYSTYITKIGGFHYYAGNPDGTCTQSDPATSSKENLDIELGIREDLLTWAKTVEATN